MRCQKAGLILATAATVGSCVWQQPAAAQQPTARGTAHAEVAPFEWMRPVDVALEPGGVLRGRVLIGERASATPSDVALYDSSGQLIATQTASHGGFEFRGLSGGVYRLVVDDRCLVVRAWSAGTAPPSAATHAILDVTEPIVRGQYPAPPFLNNLARCIKYGATKPLVVGSVLAVAVGVPVIVHNIEQDDKS